MLRKLHYLIVISNSNDSKLSEIAWNTPPRPLITASAAAAFLVYPVSITRFEDSQFENSKIDIMETDCKLVVHPVSVRRFPLRRFSPGAGLLRNPLFHWWRLRFSRGWVRKDGNLLKETGCISHHIV